MRGRLFRILRAALPTAGLFACLAGCLTPEKAEKEADETAVGLATAYWREQTGSTNEFNVSRPLDVLTLRIALEAVRQGVTNAIFPRIDGVAPLDPSNGVTYLSLDDALRLGARNNRKYQTLKETVYQRALALDTERYAFDTTFSSFLVGALTGKPELTKDYAQAGGGAKRKFEQGATLAGNMAIDVTKMIRDDWHSFAWTGDLTATVPLLRGSGLCCHNRHHHEVGDGSWGRRRGRRIQPLRSYHSPDLHSLHLRDLHLHQGEIHGGYGGALAEGDVQRAAQE